MGYGVEIIVVDGMSHDGTGQIAANAGANVVVEPRRGYGAPLMTGFRCARGHLIATADGDHTYPLEDLPRLVRILERYQLDFITTDRFSLLNSEAMTARRRFGNKILTLATRLLFDVDIQDSQSGMWVFKREKVQRLLLRSNLAFSQEIKIEAIHFGKLRWKEVPIRYRVRVGEAKFGRFDTGLKVLVALLLSRVQRSHSKG